MYTPPGYKPLPYLEYAGSDVVKKWRVQAAERITNKLFTEKLTRDFSKQIDVYYDPTIFTNPKTRVADLQQTMHTGAELEGKMADPNIGRDKAQQWRENSKGVVTVARVVQVNPSILAQRDYDPDHLLVATAKEQVTTDLIFCRAPNFMGSSERDKATFLLPTGKNKDGSTLYSLKDPNQYQRTMQGILYMVLHAAKERGDTAIVMPALGLGIYLKILESNQKELAQKLFIDALIAVMSNPEFKGSFPHGIHLLLQPMHTACVKSLQDRKDDISRLPTKLYTTATGDEIVSYCGYLKNQGIDRVAQIVAGSDRTHGGSIHAPDANTVEEWQHQMGVPREENMEPADVCTEACPNIAARPISVTIPSEYAISHSKKPTVPVAPAPIAAAATASLAPTAATSAAPTAAKTNVTGELQTLINNKMIGSILTDKVTCAMNKSNIELSFPDKTKAESFAKLLFNNDIKGQSCAPKFIHAPNNAIWLTQNQATYLQNLLATDQLKFPQASAPISTTVSATAAASAPAPVPTSTSATAASTAPSETFITLLNTVTETLNTRITRETAKRTTESDKDSKISAQKIAILNKILDQVNDIKNMTKSDATHDKLSAELQSLQTMLTNIISNKDDGKAYYAILSQTKTLAGSFVSLFSDKAGTLGDVITCSSNITEAIKELSRTAPRPS